MEEKNNTLKEVRVTVEERELVFKGIRPENMDYEVFRQVRKDIQRAYKRYKGGQFKHLSTNLGTNLSGKITPKGTYVRTEPRRHNTLDRLWKRKMTNSQ